MLKQRAHLFENQSLAGEIKGGGRPKVSKNAKFYESVADTLDFYKT